ncbi:hypothetical protein CsSME_00052727 [Camellia sinensis var. sinensis]
MAENEINTMKRRLASVTNHIAPMSISGSIGLCNCSASSSSSSFSSSSSSSMNDRYHRIHGEVPTHDPVWRLVDCDENGKEFTDIVYEKADGESIAKVQTFSLFYFLLFFFFFGGGGGVDKFSSEMCETVIGDFRKCKMTLWMILIYMYLYQLG